MVRRTSAPVVVSTAPLTSRRDFNCFRGSTAIALPAGMATMHDLPARPELLLPSQDARCHRRTRESLRLSEAAPDLETDRVGPLKVVLRQYRRATDALPAPSPLRSYRLRIEQEVSELEAFAALRTRREQTAGPTIRLALVFLKAFGRLSSLDFSFVPIEERPELVALLALEYRWCLAAAGTTAPSFKLAIGRTGAR